ncbi:hypothetical protein KLP28_14600 [Nocardioidaceae bacterium]|nr:hypothetical protein KLP28_14600 [Nocardioidaceae bacterium]
MSGKHTARRLAAVTTVAAAALTSASLAPTAAAERDTSGWSQTGYAFQNNSWAARITAVDDLRTVRLNSSRIDCTRSTGRLSRNDLAQTLGGDIASSLEEYGVNLSGLSGTNVTYSEGGRNGSRATNVIGDISIAPPLPDGIAGSAGRIVLTNVTTVADAYEDADGFHADTDISWGDLELELPSSPQLEPLTKPAQQLVDLLTKTVNDTVIKQVVQLLMDTPVPIEIPGLVSFDLGYERQVEKKDFAMAGAYGLLIEVADNGRTNGPKIELGRAYARTDGRAPSGVINGYAAAMDSTGLIDRYGSAKIPCVGTGGKVRTEKVRGLSIGDLAVIGGGTNSYMGKQTADGDVVAWAKSETKFIEVPALDLRLQDIVGRAFVKQRAGRILRTNIKGSTVGSLIVGGERLDLPKPGKRMRLPGGAILRTLVQIPNGRGLSVASAVLDMPNDGPQLKFGVANVIAKRR